MILSLMVAGKYTYPQFNERNEYILPLEKFSATDKSSGLIFPLATINAIFVAVVLRSFKPLSMPDKYSTLQDQALPLPPQ